MSRRKFYKQTPLSERLRAAREVSKLSHDKIGSIVGCSGSHLANIEAARTTPRKPLRESIEAWIGQYMPLNEKRSPTLEGGPVDAVAADLNAAITELRLKAADAQWVRRLLRILREGGDDRRIAITESIRSFIDSMEKEATERSLQHGDIGREERVKISRGG